MRLSYITVISVCMCACVTGAFAEIVRVGLPGWRVDGHHTIKHIEIIRMDVATSVTDATRSITNQTDTLDFAKHFSGFIAADEVMRQDKLKNPVFQLRVTHGKKTTTLYLSVERGVTNGKPSATVTLWHELPNGKYEEYCSRNYAPVKKTYDPQAVVLIKNLFKKDG